MFIISNKSGKLALLAMLTMSASGMVFAQEQVPAAAEGQQNGDINVYGTRTKGPEVKGFISARSGDKMQITAEDGTKSVIVIDDATKYKASAGLFSGRGQKPTAQSLLNGLPVTVNTWQTDIGLVANQVTFRKGDLKTATMIRSGTEQGFEEQTAATEALRGRMADIDKYNIKGTTNVNFDTGKHVLSAQGKADLCAAAATAESMDNALLLVVGYTDSVGDEDYNQVLSEKRASRVVNYLQQACKWKPYRMLTPTGMAEADPLADNSTPEGKAQNRRVAVNVLVSKGLDGL